MSQRTSNTRSLFSLIALTLILLAAPRISAAEYLSPAAVAASPDGKSLYIACATSDRVLVVDVEAGKVTQQWRVGAAPSGIASSADGKRIYVTCAAPESTVAVVDTGTGKVARKLDAVGHTTVAPVLSKDGKSLYVCNRFNNEVAFIDLAANSVTARIHVPREPIAAALTPDGRLLFVANHIHAGRADGDTVASSVSVIDTATAKVVKEIGLVNGSGLLRGVAVSPDGKFVAVTHLVSRFHLPTTQIERGWINTSGLTLIDVAALKPINTVLLDNIDSGAANPWAVAWSADGKRIVATHAGTHEMSVIDAPALLAKLAKMPAVLPPGSKIDYTVASHVAGDVPNDLSFLVGVRERIRLSPDHGPRAVALVGSRAFIANYFSDSLSVVDVACDRLVSRSLPLGPAVAMTPERKGEFYFNDASICFQGWQSCASCHSSDARVDGLNWDNLNDGIGNPKNSKSLLLAHETSPAMWLSVREDAYIAVRAGIKHSLFTVQPPEVADSLDAYLKGLKPIPSPHLVKGKLSKAALRGKELFEDDNVGCAECHKKSKYFTDQKSHDVGTRSEYDKEADVFDTPHLTEAWRGAPYLHDGSATTILDVLTTRNAKGEHGTTKKLSKEQLADLAEYVLSL